MKKVVLLGDSIRMNYCKYVKSQLEGVAEVYYPDDNCRFAQNLLRFAHDYKKKGGWPDDVDVVHWNAGLWDVMELYGDEPISTLEYYASVIPRIDKRLRMLYPKAKIVFATSTSVLEEEYPSYAIRRNSTIREYNKAAIAALADTDTVINDLYAITENIPREYRSDMTHFKTEKGAAMLGDKVISVVCEQMGIKLNSTGSGDVDFENYSSDKIGY
jgi:hypothetical protein